MMYLQDEDTKVENRLEEMTRASDKIFLEIASWFIPAGELIKLRYLKYASNLFKLKRGIHLFAGAADLVSQLIANDGDIRKVNIVSTLSSTLIGNPILSSVPGGFVNLSLRDGLQLNSASEFNVYKNIVLSSIGNVGGEMLGVDLKRANFIWGQFIGETYGATTASVTDEATTKH